MTGAGTATELAKLIELILNNLHHRCAACSQLVQTDETLALIKQEMSVNLDSVPCLLQPLLQVLLPPYSGCQPLLARTVPP